MNILIQEYNSVVTEERVVKPSLKASNLLKLKGRLAQLSLAKRFADVVLSTFGLFVLAICMPFFGLFIKLSSRGPILFKQKRIGLNGNLFEVYKFRTMHLNNAEGDETPVITQVGDKRLFAFGSLLRKLNLDELPQLWNVLRGEMSLVGPRPYPVEEGLYWSSLIQDFDLRYNVKPGITGLAQITGYRGGTLDIDHMEERLRRDLKYIDSFSVVFDLKIVWKTILQMLHLNTGAH